MSAVGVTEQYYIYLLSNPMRTVIYTGVTNNLKRRVAAHKSDTREGFVKKYNVTDLVYFEIFEDPYSAITREKQIKAGSRANKVDLIESMNKSWEDLYEKL